MPNPGEHHPAFEEYCECIFELREDNLDVIQARIADRLRVSRPSVSEMIKRLTEERLILVTDGHITLTDSGEDLAQPHHMPTRKPHSWFGVRSTTSSVIVEVEYGPIVHRVAHSGRTGILTRNVGVLREHKPHARHERPSVRH
jgi:hypothetical protein